MFRRVPDNTGYAIIPDNTGYRFVPDTGYPVEPDTQILVGYPVQPDIRYTPSSWLKTGYLVLWANYLLFDLSSINQK